MAQKKLTISMIALINVAAVCNIKNFPVLAEYGLSIILFLALSSVFFFIPVAFVSAELASGWPDRGVYTWVREGLGEKWGFLAIWLQWMENVIWYPTMLAFLGSTFAYIFDPTLANNKLYILSVVLVTFWPITFFNFLGMRVSGWFSSLSAVLGTLVPIALIIVLSAWFVLSGHPSQIQFSWNQLLPDLTSIKQLVLLSGILLGLAGLEMSAVHAREVENPQRNYPRAIFLSTLLIIVFSAFGGLAIGAIVPTSEIELASGSMEAFRQLFHTLHMPWAVPVLAVIMTFGGLGMLSTWIVGPSRGLLATTENGDLPPIFQKTNKQGMPVAILITQAIIVTLLSSLILFMPTVSSSYWIFVALASILYMIMYILMFLAAIRLRKIAPHIPRVYQVPGGSFGLFFIATLGIIGSAAGCILGFLPPSQLDTGSLISYEVILIGGAILFCAIPFWIIRLRKPHWKK